MAASIDDVLGRMDVRLDRAIRDNDPRGYFAAVYRAVTARVRDGILAGEFDDCDRMERFDVTFAELYLDAADAHDRGERVSASWQVAFDHSTSPLLVLQHVLTGMNAHINLDLGVAAVRTAPGPQIDELHSDFERLNDVLCAMVDRMQDAIAVVSPWTGAVDRLAGRVDEVVSSWSITHARGRAWAFARSLADASDAGAAVAERDRRVASMGLAIVRPRRLLRPAIAAARRREHADVRTVATALRDVDAGPPAG